MSWLYQLLCEPCNWWKGEITQTLPASVAFTSEQQHCLTQLAPSLQGRTQKQQNPYLPNSLAWATWLIAGLRGWSGYRSQRLPGMPTLVHGLRQLEWLFLGWKLAQTPLVCTR
ncbi:hypothetical protein H6F63_11320 [Trichocoleus sp. FACHB-40]|nr:hypothetical protein [Trichocoleus sp. FACHB-40]